MVVATRGGAMSQDGAQANGLTQRALSGLARALGSTNGLMNGEVAGPYKPQNILVSPTIIERTYAHAIYMQHHHSYLSTDTVSCMLADHRSDSSALALRAAPTSVSTSAAMPAHVKSSDGRAWSIQTAEQRCGRLQVVLASLRRMSACGLCATIHNIRWGVVLVEHG